MSLTHQILPGTGRGTSVAGGGGSLNGAALRLGANPLRQPLRGCHLPINGEEL